MGGTRRSVTIGHLSDLRPGTGHRTHDVSPLNATRPPDQRRLFLLVGLGLLAVVVGGLVDLYLDDPETWQSFHVLVEAGIVAISLALALYLLREWARTEEVLERTEEELDRHREERDRWRERARTFLEGLGREIDRQFDEWELTPSEKEVALLLIKGFSHRAIAEKTGRSERTSRQHAGSVYEKADLAGRAELAAFFLEDVRLPEQMDRSGTPGTVIFSTS